MIPRTHTGTFGTRGPRTLLVEAYRAIPVGGGLGSNPPTLKLLRRTVADHLPKVPLNDGLSDYLHASRTFPVSCLSRLAFTARDVTAFNLSI